MENILAVAIESIKGRIDGKFTESATSEALKKAFIELNGGSTKISPKTFRPGHALFDLAQEILPIIIEEGINSSTNPLFKLVEYRNVAEGDLTEFVIEGDANFVVSSIANGIQGVRRQRIVGGETVRIPTEVRIIRVYENLGRLLAGRIDFNQFVDGVAKAFNRFIVEAAYTALIGITANTQGLDATYVKSGVISEDDLLALVAHVEAATGKKAAVLGTKVALRKFGSAITYSVEQNSDLYNQGYIGKISGVDVIALDQAHKPGTSEFILADDAIWVIAADDKPIKLVNEGDGLLINREATENADLTQEYAYAQAFGIGVIAAAKLGYWTSIV